MRAQVSEGLRALRAALNESKGGYVLGGQLSYADITLAAIVRSICPLHQPRQCAALRHLAPLVPDGHTDSSAVCKLTFCRIRVTPSGMICPWSHQETPDAIEVPLS